MSKLYIGLMSGTSADGAHAALVDLGQPLPKLIDLNYQPFSQDIRQQILNLCQPGPDEINRLGELDTQLGKLFADGVNQLLKKNQLSANQVIAIGSHGQTVRHHPLRQFTLQIGDPNIIASETGITTVADFRRRDIALGGQGAPLVPAFHQAVFSDKTVNRIIVNIGGIANLTLLKKEGTVLGYDTGPGNMLLDLWSEIHLQKPFDDEGAWARQGRINHPLLNHFMEDRFFDLPPPKSSGREDFNHAWLKAKLLENVSPVDVQATLVELTACTIVNAVKSHCTEGDLFICGGGAHNHYLLERITQWATPLTTQTTDALSVPPDSVEAMAFAWLAQQTLTHHPGNLPEVTGAKTKTILGGIYFGNPPL